MRFIVLVVGGVAAGALSGSALQMIVPQNNQMLAAVRALGGSVASIRLDDVNPLKAYDDVKRHITSGDLGRSLNLGSSNPISTAASFPKIEDLGLGSKLHIDSSDMRRAWAAGINSQIQQSNRRMEDMSAYARNPTAWHGLPPH